MGGNLSLFTPKLAPKESAGEPDSYRPSDRMIKYVLTPAVKNFREIPGDGGRAVQLSPTDAGKKILVYCTSTRLVRCANGKYFNSGHHPAETFVPLYHWDKAGFAFEFVTMDGGKVAVEEWAFAACKGFETQIRSMQAKQDDAMKNPRKTSDIDPTAIADHYLAIFMPGGHAPIIDTPKDQEFGAILHAASKIGLPTISICHGPAALLSAAASPALLEAFPYKGYEICVFPDKQDDQAPGFGYLPGKLSVEDKAEANLRNLGFVIKNKKMDDSTHVHKELITGASQLSAQNLAELVLKILLDKYDTRSSGLGA